MKGRIVLLLALCLPLLADKPETSTSNLAIPTPVTRGISALSYSTGFEGSEGFTPGFLGNQDGWSYFAVSSAQPTISINDAYDGTQSLEIAGDGGVGVGNLTGGFSPLISPGSSSLQTLRVRVKITDTDGADYDIAPQAPSQGFLSARVNFRFTGPIRILDGGGFVDSGFTWPVDQWFLLEIVMDPVAETINYYMDGALIYSAGSLVGGTSFEQVVILSDNWHVTDTGFFDGLSFGVLQLPVPAFGTYGLGIFMALLLISGVFFMRRKSASQAV